MPHTIKNGNNHGFNGCDLGTIETVVAEIGYLCRKFLPNGFVTHCQIPIFLMTTLSDKLAQVNITGTEL